MQVREYDRGKRDGIKYAVRWLQREALQMNDPWAKDILNRVADHLGKAGKQETINAKGDLLELALKRAAAQ